MFTPDEHRRIVSSDRGGLGGAVWRTLFRLVECPYGVAVGVRNRRYDRREGMVTKVAAPVISVGNITTGGTGKTPMVEWIARRLRSQNIRVTLISRGYGAEKGAVNDEAKELEERLNDVPHVQDPDRIAAAELAIEEFNAQLLLLDDAFQHRRIHRDLDIVLIDAACPFGFGHLLPRGYLREPLTGLRRADAIVLTRADMVTAEAKADIQQTVRKYNQTAIWAEVAHAPQHLRNSTGEVRAIASLTDQPVAAFCGIGNPEGFRHTLKTCQMQVQAFREFPDHHAYPKEDVESLLVWSDQQPSVQAIICTHKDLVKVGVPHLHEKPLWAVVIGMKFSAGEEELQALIDAAAKQIDRA